jgi:hypothetical protein
VMADAEHYRGVSTLNVEKTHDNQNGEVVR